MTLDGSEIREDMYILVSAPGSWPEAYKTLVNFLSDKNTGNMYCACISLSLTLSLTQVPSSPCKFLSG